MDRLTAEDRLMLWSDGSWSQDIGALAILDGRTLLDSDGRFRIEKARAAIESRLHLVPRFRQILYEPRRGRGWPLWIDAPRFDLRDHVQVAQLPVPGDEAQLLLTMERLRRNRLDRSRPLWEIWFLPGLPDARIAMFIRLHHVVADGIAGVAGLASLLDTVPGTSTAPAPPWVPRPRPTDRELVSDNVRRRAGEFGHTVNAVVHPVRSLRRVRAGWPAIRELLAQQPGPRTSLNRLVGAKRTLALVRSDLDLVTRVAHANAATVNDVLLTVTAGGLRGLLRSRAEPIEDLTLPIYVPVSLRRDRSRPGVGNLISQMVVPLPVGIADAAERLRRIAKQTAHQKADVRPSLGAVFRNKVMAGMMIPLVAKKRVNIESADLPGPAGPLYFCGAQLLEVFPLLNLIGNVSLGVGALSYAGHFFVMAVGDADAYPDIEVFAAGVRDELRSLAGTRTAVRAMS